MTERARIDPRIIIIIIIIIIMMMMMMMTATTTTATTIIIMMMMMITTTMMMIIIIIIIVVVVVALKGAIRDFFFFFFFLTISSLRSEPSPTRTLKWPERNRVRNSFSRDRPPSRQCHRRKPGRDTRETTRLVSFSSFYVTRPQLTASRHKPLHPGSATDASRVEMLARLLAWLALLALPASM